MANMFLFLAAINIVILVYLTIIDDKISDRTKEVKDEIKRLLKENS